jgi:hypothetical protein
MMLIGYPMMGKQAGPKRLVRRVTGVAPGIAWEAAG